MMDTTGLNYVECIVCADECLDSLSPLEDAMKFAHDKLNEFKREKFYEPKISFRNGMGCVEIIVSGYQPRKNVLK